MFLGSGGSRLSDREEPCKISLIKCYCEEESLHSGSDKINIWKISRYFHEDVSIGRKKKG